MPVDTHILVVLGEMVNLQKENLPKSRPKHKMTNKASKALVDVLSKLTFRKLAISPSIAYYL
jgi:hypothetical protein